MKPQPVSGPACLPALPSSFYRNGSRSQLSRVFCRSPRGFESDRATGAFDGTFRNFPSVVWLPDIRDACGKRLVEYGIDVRPCITMDSSISEPKYRNRTAFRRSGIISSHSVSFPVLDYPSQNFLSVFHLLSKRILASWSRA